MGGGQVSDAFMQNLLKCHAHQLGERSLAPDRWHHRAFGAGRGAAIPLAADDGGRPIDRRAVALLLGRLDGECSRQAEVAQLILRREKLWVCVFDRAGTESAGPMLVCFAEYH